MTLALDGPFRSAARDPEQSPLVLNPAELRQLWQCYYDLLELHHAEISDEQFDSAHELLVEQVLPLQQILKGRQRVLIDPRAQLTY